MISCASIKKEDPSVYPITPKQETPSPNTSLSDYPPPFIDPKAKEFDYLEELTGNKDVADTIGMIDVRRAPLLELSLRDFSRPTPRQRLERFVVAAPENMTERWARLKFVRQYGKGGHIDYESRVYPWTLPPK
ncbi:hypothetical protein CMO96_00170 [Candidatus Woesebacteria bacterium]|nr:hypothetical protein [Candidatus Woesebacteria bacterium]|tara:strand:+ start:220 stop:618 length:399 start_codon:yes stop_codon:yes gene_type:complete